MGTARAMFLIMAGMALFNAGTFQDHMHSYPFEFWYLVAIGSFLLVTVWLDAWNLERRLERKDK